MESLRTPEECFADLPDYGYHPRYAQVDSGDGSTRLRMAYVEAGPSSGPVVVLLHGEPSWGFLYRHVVPPLVAAGLRAVVPDLIGFGRSDKPTEVADYSYARHVEWTRALLFDALDLHDVTMVGQDWGGLIGLRLVAEHPHRIARVVAANTGLPTGDQAMPELWWRFHDFVARTPELPIGFLVASGCTAPLSPEVLAAYEAPFPDASYQAGARAFPGLVPNAPDDPAAAANRAAWEVLGRFDRPFLTAFSDGDPITRGVDVLLQRLVPGCAGQPHTTIAGAGHFLQEDRGAELGQVLADFVTST
ncbi:MAG TPA: haloalkane dehalogenase [Mycobacteriales bacterium]|nr:haloalkane dehalogenase [Mycobacteriales bacterium]